jgi:hypothetical protein
MLIYANYMTISQQKMADDDVDDVMLAAASFCYMYDSSEVDVGDNETKKRVCRPHRFWFWIHDVIHGRQVSKASVTVAISQQLSRWCEYRGWNHPRNV